MINLEPGIKLSLRADPSASDEDLQFIRQIGVEHVFAWVADDERDAELLTAFRQRLASHGLTLFNAANLGVCKNDKIHLGLPGRDEAIDDFTQFIRALGRAGIHTTTFTWEPYGDARSTTMAEIRGGARARAIDMEVMEREEPTHEGTYTHDDIWENFAYFVERVVPVAEEAGVRLSLHPNDPPVPDVGGIPCLIYNAEGFKRAFDICDSPNLGMELCTGCWLEGGEAFGNLLDDIRYFVGRDKVFIAHFRNVSGTLPKFVETFADDGDMDMLAVVRAFEEAGYQGTLMPDHADEFDMIGGAQTGVAYAIGYMKGLLAKS